MEEPKIIGKPVILVVDDSAEWVESVDFSLGDDYMVVASADLAAAAEMARRYAPEVMLLDWKIARREPELARVGLSTDRKAMLPVILVTGIERPEVENIADLIGGCVAIVERLDTLDEVKREIAKVISCAEG